MDNGQWDCEWAMSRWGWGWKIVVQSEVGVAISLIIFSRIVAMLSATNKYMTRDTAQVDCIDIVHAKPSPSPFPSSFVSSSCRCCF